MAIEKLDDLAAPRPQAASIAMSTVSEYCAKDGFYVPESDSSPAPSVISVDGDDDSDVVADDESRSSPPVVDCASSQESENPQTPDVVEGNNSFSSAGEIHLYANFSAVSCQKVIKPIEIIDADLVPETIIIDEAPSDVTDSDLEVDMDCDEVYDEDDGDIYDDDEDNDDESEKYSYGFKAPSDDDEDIQDLEDGVADDDSLRESSVESDGPCRPNSLPPAPRRDAWPTMIPSEPAMIPMEPTPNNTLKPGPASAPAPVRRLEIDALLNSTNPIKKPPIDAEQAEVEHFLTKHPNDQSSGPHLSNPHSTGSQFFGNGALNNAFPHLHAPAPPNHVVPCELFDEPFYPRPYGVAPQQSVQLAGASVEDSEQDYVRMMVPPQHTYTSIDETYDPWYPSPPAVNNTAASRLAAANSTSLSMLGGSKKRSFDVFDQDSDCEKPATLSVAPEDAVRKLIPNECLSPISDKSVSPTPVRMLEQDTQLQADPTTVSASSAQPEAQPREPPSFPASEEEEVKIDTAPQEPPRKRARLQSAAKTAGTVLASAVAGGVATFYALGLTPESFFT